MSALVPSEDIERIVGAPRHVTQHIARAVSAEQTVYILHSHWCRAATPDLRDCIYSIALDQGISVLHWAGHEDTPVRVTVTDDGELIPCRDEATS